MKRRVLYTLLTAVAIVGGVALAGSGPRSTASVGSTTPTPAFTISYGYKCPVGQGIANVIVDGWEHRPKATPQRAVAMVIANEPELPFDADARVDLDKSPRSAAFALRDPDGYLLERLRTERVLSGWVFAGWTSCGRLGAAASSDPEPSVEPESQSGAPSDASDSGSTDPTETKSTGTAGQQPKGTIRQALGVIRRHVDVPVALPNGMPQDVRLADRHPIYRPVKGDPHRPWTLHLVYGRHDHVLLVTFGDAPFDGCDVPPARRVRISSTPGLLALTRKHGRVVWSQLVWPADHAHPVGRYGLFGSLSPNRLIEMARTMPRVQPSWLMPQGC